VSHPVIPAPWRYQGGGPGFAVAEGTAVAFGDAGLAPLVERFCADIARRTGRGPVPAPDPAAGGAGVRIEVGPSDELAGLPAPAGLAPAGGEPADERYSLVVDRVGIRLRAAGPVGVARGLTTLTQLVAAGEAVPGGRILDGPRYAWRGLSLDLARTHLPLEDVRRVVDLLALYKLNVLHLHLTDDQGWRLPVGRPEGGTAAEGGACYPAGDLRALVAYAADRYVTIVPEVDTPGHTLALLAMRPHLRTGRNEVTFELPPGQMRRAAWLDPELPATWPLVEEVLAGVADLFPAPYLHIGGDEPRVMPHGLYAAYVGRVRDIVRSLGRRPLGWQESARAGLGPGDAIQYWLSDLDLPASLPAAVREQMDAELAASRADVEAAIAASAPVIVSPLSHCYLDVPYAGPAPEPAQEERRRRVGLRLYPRTTVERAFAWEPADVLGPGRADHVAGVEAAVWAETVADADDLTFLLLPRLPGVAHRAWSPRGSATWPDHRARLAAHARLWDQDGVTYFRTGDR
jgi:hexosaminidase